MVKEAIGVWQRTKRVTQVSKKKKPSEGGWLAF